LGEAVAEADLSQFAKWHSKKHARRSYPVGNRPKIYVKGDRTFRSEDSAIGNYILGTLASFSTVFVIAFIGTEVADRQDSRTKQSLSHANSAEHPKY